MRDKLAAGCGLGDGAEREAGVRADAERRPRRPRGAGIAFRQHDLELAVAEPDAAQLCGDRGRERLGRRLPCGAQLAVDPRHLASARCRAASAARAGSWPSSSAASSRAPLPRARAAPRRSGAVPAAQIRELLELRLDLLEPPRLCFERREKRLQVGSGLVQLQLGLAQGVAGGGQLGREALDRRDGSLRRSDEVARAGAVLGRERRGGGRGRLHELREVPQALALGAQLVLACRLAPFGIGCEQPKLVDPRSGRRGVARQLVVQPPGPLQLAPRRARGGRVDARERVEHVALVRRARQPPLLELAAHREKCLRGGSDVLPRGAPTPRVGARAAVGEDRDARARRRPPLRDAGRRATPSASSPTSSNSASTYASSPAAPISAASPFAPSSRPTAFVRIVFPAPVSPVIAFRPGASSSSASRMRTRFEMRRVRNTSPW